MKVLFVNIDKRSINKLEENIKYVLITENKDNLRNYLNLKIKPIIILYNGAYVIDLEKNSVIIKKSIDEKSCNKIINYSNHHNVNMRLYKKDDNVYEIKITTDNYHRRLIIPYMFKDLIPSVSTVTRGKSIFITNKNASLINAIDEVLNYLNITNNFIDLENIYVNISSEGYYKDKESWKGYDLYEN